MRRNAGRHADRDAIGAVHQKVRQPCRKDRGFLGGFVVVRLNLDRILVDIRQQRLTGDMGELSLSVAHGRRRITVD